MKHEGVIKQEFIKQARKWNELTRDEQKRYLKKHPGSKRRMTAGSDRVRAKALETVKGIKRLFSRVKKLDRFSTRLENIKSWRRRVNLKRNKVFWNLEKALDGKRSTGLDPYNLRPGTAGEIMNAREKLVTKRLNHLITRIANAYDDLPANKETKQQVLDYIKTHYLVERKIKVPSKVESIKKEPKVKVKKTKQPEYIGIGDRVRLSNGIEMTVTSVKHGHKWITVKGDTDDGAHWHSKQRSMSYGGSNMKFLGKSAQKDTEKHVKNRRDFERSIDDDKMKGKIQGRKKLEDLNVRAGDTVVIRGTHYNWEAKVMSLDYRQGGVRIDQMRQRRRRSFFGFGGAIGQPHYRFIPARFIVSKKS
jgi:translation initiation factor IF-1